MRRADVVMLSLLAVLTGCAVLGDGPRDIDRIEHLVVIYQENWSFDSLFGTFPGANGIANATDAIRQVDRNGRPYATLPPAIDTTRRPPAPDPRIPSDLPVAPFDLGKYIRPHEFSGDPVHRYYQHIAQINGGRNDSFVAWTNVGGLVMSYYNGTTLPLGRLAREYVLADNFFQAAFGGSYLNHAWLVCACTPVWREAPADMRAQLDAGGRVVRDGAVTPDGYIVNTAYSVNAPHPADVDAAHLVPNQTWPTIGERLSDKGVSWAWYSGGWSDALTGHPAATFQFHHQPFAYFAPYADGAAAKARHLKDEAELLVDLGAGRLPAVVFVKPLGIDNEHPGYATLLRGQQHVEDLVRAIAASPYWTSTAIVITYDEFGGRWDHVAPPASDRWGPGSRVPTVIVSPYARRGHVDHTVYDTTSILKFIETRWRVAPLGPRDAAAHDLTAAFDFSAVRR